VHALLALAAVLGLSADLPYPDAPAWREAAAGSIANAELSGDDPGPRPRRSS
jgi:hypothetical protein